MFISGISGRVYYVLFKLSSHQYFIDKLREEDKKISDYSSQDIRNQIDAFEIDKLIFSENSDREFAQRGSVWSIKNFPINFSITREALKKDNESKPIVILVDAIVNVSELRDNEIEVFPITSDISKLSGDLENVKNTCISIDNISKAGFKANSWIIPSKISMSGGLLKNRIGDISDSLLEEEDEHKCE
jgi:hypothetical protein